MPPAAQPFLTWTTEVLLPMWRGPGLDPATGFAHEALTRDGRPAGQGLHRTLVAARLAYFYTRCARRAPAERAAWEALAARQIGLIDTVLRDRSQGGWYYSVDDAGMPRDPDKDLYTHAFVVFAMAEFAALTGDAQWLEEADEASVLLDRFATGDGAWHARCTRDFATGLAGPAQNPLMHGFEAVSRLCALTGESRHLRLLGRIADVIEQRFAVPEADRILELPLGTLDNRVEPGHQYEWFSLAAASPLAERLGVASGGRVHRMLRRVLRDGMSPAGLLPLAFTPDYEQVSDPVHRVWTQLECIRALHTAHRLDGDAALAEARDAALRALHAHYLRPDGWVEVVHDGKVIRAEQPASTPYHFITCLDDLAPV